MSTKIVILTAVEKEYEVLRKLISTKAIGNCKEDVFDAYFYERFKLNVSNVTIEVILGFTNQGNCEASIVTTDALKRYKPDVSFFVGTCGGIKNVKIGDSVIANAVFDILRGKDEKEWISKPTGSNLSSKLSGICKSVMFSVNRGDILKDFYNSNGNKVHIGDIGSGSAIVASSSSQIKSMIKKHYGNIIAIEMEGYGFYKALKQNGEAIGVLVRAVTDDSSNKDDETDEVIQPLVMEKTCFLVYELIQKYMELKIDSGNMKGNIELNESEEELCEYFFLQRSSDRKLLVKSKKNVFAAFISFDMNYRNKLFLHLGHCYFIKIIDELIKRGKHVRIYVCSSPRNFTEMNKEKYENYITILNLTLNRFKKCFDNKVNVTDIGKSLREDNFGDNQWEEKTTIYLNRVENAANTLTNNVEEYGIILAELEKWRECGEFNKDYLADIEHILDISATEMKSKKINNEEVIAMAYVFLKKPKWYSQSWIIQFIQFFTHAYMETQNVKEETLIIESKKNAYTWLSMSFLAKKMERKFPAMLFFKNVLNIDGKRYMKSSESDKAINSDNYLKLDYSQFSSEFCHETASLFNIPVTKLDEYIKKTMSDSIERFSID